MSVTAEAVKQLRERTGAGMMECKRALVDAGGDLDAAAELMRKSGLAKADNKAGRIAAEGVIAIDRSADGRRAAIVEVNSETDFVAREAEFKSFAAAVAVVAHAAAPGDLAALAAARLPSGKTVEETRRELVARLGENIGVRRFDVIGGPGPLGAYLHGTRIGALVLLDGGDETLARELAMHVAAINPQYGAATDVPADVLERERSIFVAQVESDPKAKGKPAEIVAKMVEGKLRKFVGEITLTGQPFVKDDKVAVGEVLRRANARVVRFVRFEVGAGIQKRQENFAAEVMAQVRGA